MTRRSRPAWMVVPRRALARWIIPLYATLAVGLVPWVAWLVWTLPAHTVTSHYRLAWVGFDVLLCGALARTAYLAWRRSPFVVNVASATAALLVVDAWFDVTTSQEGADVVVALVLAVLVELPLAVLSLTIAARAQIEIARTGAVRPRPRVLRWMAESPLGMVAAEAGADKPPNPPPDAAAPAVAPPAIVAAGPTLADPKPLAGQTGGSDL